MQLDEIIILHQSGQLEEAKQAYLEWLNYHPSNTDIFHYIWNKLGSIYFSQQQWAEAISAYQQAISCRSDYVDAYYNLGLTYNKLRSYEQAAIVWRSLLELDVNHAGANFQLGCLLMREKKHSEAMDFFIKINNNLPAYMEAQANLATCCLQLGWLNKAKLYYLKVLAEVPDDTTTLFNLGVVQGQLGDLQDAIQTYLHITAIDPQFFAAFNNLGVVYLALKQPKAAKTYFQAALNLQPGNEALRHILAVLNQEKAISATPHAYLTQLFDSYADHYDNHLTQSLHYQVPVQFYEMFHQSAHHSTAGLQVLDLGCGTGLCGSYFKSISSKLVGVDLSEKMLAIAHTKQLYDELVQADITTFLQTHNNTYDVILAGDVMVYAGDLSLLFKSIHHGLKPSSCFMFNVEATDDGPYHLTSTGRFAHHRQYIENLLKDNQFEILAFRIVTLRLQNNTPVKGYMYLCVVVQT